MEKNKIELKLKFSKKKKENNNKRKLNVNAGNLKDILADVCLHASLTENLFFIILFRE